MGLPAALMGPQQAQLTLTLSSPLAPNATPFGPFIQQLGLNGTLRMRRLVPYLGLDNLLTASFGNAAVSGTQNAGNAVFHGSDHDDTFAGSLVFSSDFINFSLALTSEEDFAIALSSLTPGLRIAPDGQLRSFRAAGSGTFSAEPVPTGPIPEPASMALLGGGLLALATVRLHRRR
jgi:hypothetical protein